jgi:hypothetical protein
MYDNCLNSINAIRQPLVGWTHPSESRIFVNIHQRLEILYTSSESRNFKTIYLRAEMLSPILQNPFCIHPSNARNCVCIHLSPEIFYSSIRVQKSCNYPPESRNVISNPSEYINFVSIHQSPEILYPSITVQKLCPLYSSFRVR